MPYRRGGAVSWTHDQKMTKIYRFLHFWHEHLHWAPAGRSSCNRQQDCILKCLDHQNLDTVRKIVIRQDYRILLTGCWSVWFDIKHDTWNPFKHKLRTKQTTYDQTMTKNHRVLHVWHNTLLGCSYFRFDHGCMPFHDICLVTRYMPVRLVAPLEKVNKRHHHMT